MPQKKTKFVDINSGDIQILPGRHRCECQATKHPLINNCLSCGRIVCSQEGAGPCFFCNSLVLTADDKRKVREGGKKALYIESKFSKLGKPVDKEVLRRAEAESAAFAHKEKLLGFEKNSEKRTRVIDDQSDYFDSSNKWLSEEDRELAKKKKQAYLDMKKKINQKMRVTIDVTGRRILEEKQDTSFLENFGKMAVSEPDTISMNVQDDFFNYPRMLPEFVGELEKVSDTKPIMWTKRIQDSDLQEMSDDGNCLSILQPWASFIIDGIKRFEGRNWYTPIRGRLWIIAGGKPAATDSIERAQITYRNIVKDVEFPDKYPLGCLLGCVDLVDCLPQEEFIKLYPNGEVADPYVFVLANPKQLPFTIPVQGKQKIFKLDSIVHQSAKKHVNLM